LEEVRAPHTMSEKAPDDAKEVRRSEANTEAAVPKDEASQSAPFPPNLSNLGRKSGSRGTNNARYPLLGRHFSGSGSPVSSLKSPPSSGSVTPRMGFAPALTNSPNDAVASPRISSVSPDEATPVITASPQMVTSSVPAVTGPNDVATVRTASWGKPSKKHSLEDDVPDDLQIKFGSLEAPAAGNHVAGPPPTTPSAATTHTAIFSTGSPPAVAASSRSSGPPAAATATTTPASISPPRPKSSDGSAEEEQLRAALAASERDEGGNVDIEEFKGCARNLREVVRTGVEVNTDLVETLLNLCKQAQIEIQRCIEALTGKGEDLGFGDLEVLFDLGGIISSAIEDGEDAVAKNQNVTTYKKSPSLDVDQLVEEKDVFTLICTLRSQQDDRGLDAAMALMRFARDAECGNEDQIRLRDEIRSSGGMHSLLTLFRARGNYERKVVAALAIAYLLPSFLESSSQTPPSLSLKIAECISFLCKNARDVYPKNETISSRETFEAATAALATFWINYLGPRLNSETSSVIEGADQVSAQHDSFPPLRRARSLTRSGAVFDQRREIVALRELLEVTVSLIIYVARRSDEHKTHTLVEQVCAIEIARPVAVREGILQVLVEWLETTGARAATIAMCYLTSIKDKYMAGWIHSEMINKGAVAALVKLTPVEHEVRLATVQILASLCAAPHTRAAVVEANCISFLIGFLPDVSESSSEEVVLFAGSALVQLAAGAIARAVVLSGDDREVRSLIE
jgi:hypothetical protein